MPPDLATAFFTEKLVYLPPPYLPNQMRHNHEQMVADNVSPPAAARSVTAFLQSQAAVRHEYGLPPGFGIGVVSRPAKVDELVWDVGCTALEGNSAARYPSHGRQAIATLSSL